jgi:N-terminal half of MaoC dehydratase
VSILLPIEAGAILMFARSLGDLNPRWYDEESEAAKCHGGVSAPPTFVATIAQFDPDWPYRPTPGEPWWGSGRGPGTPAPTTGGSGGTSLHAEQHYEYTRPLRPGDVLSAERVEGKTWEKQSARAGTLRFSEEITRFHDQAGELVMTATRVRVVTERPVEG